MSGSAARLEDLGATIAGRYRIEQTLGGGGMGAVYRVVDLRTDQRIALKRGLKTSGSRASKRKDLLEREFHTLAQLAHPRIIEVYDYGVDERGPYYTMELLDGSDLHKAGKLPWRTACALLRDVASSLALLHSRGLIHRDVSARNVRCTADGRAKLMDFGAMTPTGVAKDVVGTPPFLAPEVLQMQALDGRADLYSLGALGYYMLTGQHAYPARRFRELRDAWRSRPPAPQRFAPDVPAQLNALILQLLSLDRGTRPHSAAEVMQRLSTIAGLPLEEQLQVSRAYLTSPVLVGRDASLLTLRRQMLALGRGDGCSILIHGAPGSGRSRLLDACALEAKLVGAAVVRADAGDERSDWGVARVLGRQLVQLMPEQALDAARLSRDVLGQVIDELRQEGGSSTSAAVGERSLLIRELRDFMLSLARLQRLVIVIDDAEQIDEQSAALLAALAHKTERHPLILVVAADLDAGPRNGDPLRLLHLISQRIVLTQLSAEQTETLLCSVFGEVPQLPLLSGRIHAQAQGNPRTIMELAQHMVDRGLARYEAGAWSLPNQLGEHDLPASLAASLSARIAALSPDAREICEALCIADADTENLSLASYVELTTHRDQRRAFAALDDLIVARILSGDAERYRFSQRGFVPVLESMLAPERRRWLHARMASILASVGGDVLRRGHHLFYAGREPEAIALLRSIDLVQRSAPLSLLEAAVESAERHELSARTVHELRRALVMRAALEMASDCFRNHVPILFRELERDAGLTRYRELEGMPEAERLSRALGEQQRRFQDTPDHERVYPIPEAIRALASLCATQRGVALSVFDKVLLDAVPSLEPLVTIAPAIELGILSGLAHRDTLHGRFQSARARYQQVLTRISQPDAAGLSPDEQQRVRFGAHYVLGLIDAGAGVASAEAHAQVLEGERAFRVNAWRVRTLWHMTLADPEEAMRCRRRAELILLQEGGGQYAGTNGLGDLACHVLSGDLIAVKQATEAVARLALRAPGWRPFEVYGHAAALLLQGEPQAALELIIPELDRIAPGEHAAYAYLAAMRVNALHDLGRTQEAVQLGRDYLAICEREGLTPTGYVLHVATALALGQGGAHDEAVELLETVIAQGREHEQRGVCLGTMYEARARIATLMRDGDAFSHYSDLCAIEYRHGRNPVLGARLSRLREEAQGHEVGGPDSLSPQPAGDAAPNSEFATIHSRMLECVDQNDRARCALTLLLQALDSFTGYLFGVNDKSHTLLSSLPEDEHDAELEHWFSSFIAHELETDSLDGGEPDSPTPPYRFVDAHGRSFEPQLLVRADGAQQRLAAVLIFQSGSDTRRRPSRELQQELAEQLLEHGDVSGAVLETAGTRTRTR